ncbi:hypothetical protein JW859_13450 [bacterium]|nr:hypothetical protein [bacterium]
MSKVSFTRAALLGAVMLLVFTGAAGAGDRRQVVVTDKPLYTMLPSAAADAGLDSIVLSGLDYTAVAPPGVRVRVVEDEPYSYVNGNRQCVKPYLRHGLSRLTLYATSPAGGSYEARINLRQEPGLNGLNTLRLSFDTAASYIYTHSLLGEDQRGQVAYALEEIRSPLGLTDPDDRDNRHREYLRYSAAVINPLVWQEPVEEAPGDVLAQAAPDAVAEPAAVEEGDAAIIDSAASAESIVVLAESLIDSGSAIPPADDAAAADDAPEVPAADETTAADGEAEEVEPRCPYQYVAGQLKVLRRANDSHYLLTIEITAEDFANSLTLTENLARCIINRLDAELAAERRLDYLAYYPEFEYAIPYFDGETPPAATADLAERPGEGCGLHATPITGDVCPACGTDGRWPAEPYADAEFADTLARSQVMPVCSHCLMVPGLSGYDAVNQLAIPCCCETCLAGGACADCAARPPCDACKQDICTHSEDGGCP